LKPAIWYFAQHNSAVFAEQTPYAGRVVAVAWDGVSATYVVFEQAKTLKIGKRLDSTGSYASPTTLTTSGWEQFDADVVAYHGRWWAVWSEQLGTGSEQLFQRHTLFGIQGRTRITVTPTNLHDLRPSLALYNGWLTLVWERWTATHLGLAVLRIATSTGGPWTSRQLTGAGRINMQPDVTVYAGVTYVTWQRDDRTTIASNESGPFASRTFPLWTVDPSVAVSRGHVFVGATTPDQRLGYVRERDSGGWTGAVVTGSGALQVVMLAQAGEARMIYGTSSALRMRTQV
ncbi:MAG TPA: hypothetical protein VE441_02970, partial [Mycobacterium sp.]|nr:hypothetical protein [Mycobacterium sp.]